MKPRKSFRKIVNSLIGKKTKSTLQDHEAVIEERIAGKRIQSRRQHGSTDDLLTDNATINSNSHYRSKKKTRSQSLPRRSRSCNSFKSAAQTQIPASCNEIEDQLPHVKDRRSCLSKSDSQDIQQCSIKEKKFYPTSLRRRQSVDGNTKFRDHGTIQRTTSLNIGRFEPNERSRTSSDRESMDRNTSRDVSRLGEISSLRRTCSAIVSQAGREETEDKLKTCRSVLDRLTAQVQEIKVASQHLNEKQRIGAVEKTDPKVSTVVAYGVTLRMTQMCLLSIRHTLSMMP